MGKGESDEATILAYLTKHNRPFSLQQIVDGMQSAGIKKTACDRAVAELVSKDVVTMKEFGKAKIFLCNQKTIEIPNEEEMVKIDQELVEKGEQLKELGLEHSKLAKDVSELESTISLPDAKARCAELEDSIASLKVELEKFGPESEQITAEDREKIESTYKKMRKEWINRKRMAKQVIEMISEGSGKKPAELYEEMGLEVDDDEEAKLAAMPNPDANGKKRLNGQRQQRQLKKPRNL